MQTAPCLCRKCTPAQRLALPVLLDSRDLVLCAQTGSGKTAGFLIPMIQSILNGQQYRTGHPLGIVLAPTRELCCQTYDEARKFVANTGLHVCYAYGGTKSWSQVLACVYVGVGEGDGAACGSQNVKTDDKWATNTRLGVLHGTGSPLGKVLCGLSFPGMCPLATLQQPPAVHQKATTLCKSSFQAPGVCNGI